MSQRIVQDTKRIALGTAQFGLDYGITGAKKIAPEEVIEILKVAQSHQLNTLDTAIAYGDSERVLGEADIAQWWIVTKLPALPNDCKEVIGWVLESVHQSLARLKIPRLYGLLLHQPNDLLGSVGKVLYSGLQECKENGLVEKIGVSIDEPSELNEILPLYPMDLVQTPFNVLDRRIKSSGWLDRLSESGQEIHVRSIFMQGLLLMSPEQRPAKFNRWNTLWDHWHTWLDEHLVSSLRTCLHFALSHPQIDRVVVGVDGVAHLQEILKHIDGNKCNVPPNTMLSDDIDLINPSRWNFL